MEENEKLMQTLEPVVDEMEEAVRNPDFYDKLKTVKNSDQLFELFKNDGGFTKSKNELITCLKYGMELNSSNVKELSEEDLENVVGGSKAGWKKFTHTLKSVVGYVEKGVSIAAGAISAGFGLAEIIGGNPGGALDLVEGGMKVAVSTDELIHKE